MTDNSLCVSMEQPSDESRGVLAVCVYNDNSFGMQIGPESHIYDLKNFICSRWTFLTPLSFNLSFVRDDKVNVLETDSDLQSLTCFCWIKGQDTVQIDVSVTSAPDAVVVRESNPGSSSCSSVYDNDDSDLMVPIRRGDYGSFIRGPGQRFPGGASEFRICLLLYCVKNGYRVRICKNDRKRVTAVCYLREEKKCGWRVHASLKFNIPDAFFIKRMNPIHSCGAGYIDINHPSITSKVVKAFCIDQVRANPTIKTKAIMDSFTSEFGSMLKYYFAYSGKGLAIKEIHGDQLVSFNQLVWYVDSLKLTNPGSHVELEIDDSKRFKRVFISLEACISGFMHCQPLLMVDGTFLKGKVQGCLMAATGKNANQGCFPVAFAIVPGEDEDNWVWFMENLKKIIDPQREYVFISDRNWGLIKSVARVFPKCFHAFCLYHLKRNLAGSIPSYNKAGSWMVKLFTSMAYATTVDDFKAKHAMFLNIGKNYATNFLKNLPFERFTCVHFPGSRYGEMSSNVAESFNAWILDERFLPITSMLDEVRRKLMNQMAEHRELGRTYVGDLCPAMESRLKKLIDDGLQWFVSRSSKMVFEVRSPIVQRVDLEHKLCSCNLWRINGFPCEHVVRAIMVAGLNVYEYIDPYYLSSSFRSSYSSPINPIPTAQKPMALPPSPHVIPPEMKRQPGRPATKRKEGRGGGLKRKNQCSKCKGFGHNKTTCRG